MEPNVCCGAPVGARSPISCQLYVGHDGGHAALVLGPSGRLLRRWTNAVSVIDVDFTSGAASALAWAPGFPAATPEPEPSLVAVVAEPAQPPPPKGRHLHIAS